MAQINDEHSAEVKRGQECQHCSRWRNPKIAGWSRSGCTWN